MEQKKRKKHGRGRAIAAAVVALVLIAAAILALLYRDRLTSEGLSGAFAGERTPEADTEPFTYEVGSDQVFAAAGNALAVASTTGIQLLDAKGHTIAREVFSMDTPAVSASEACSTFFDVGGTALRVAAADGTIAALDTEQTILSAQVNDAGWIAVVTEESGYKAMVTVYNAALQPVYVWHSGAAYVLSAQVSPDCRSMAVLCADDEGGLLHLFSLAQETPVGSFSAPGELLMDLRWMDRDRVCLLSETRLVFVDGKGIEVGSYSLEGQYLLDYDLGGDGFAALLLGKYRSGGDSLLVTVDTSSGELGRTEVRQRDVVSISAGEDTLLVLYSDALELMTRTLSPINSYTEILGVKRALLRQDGKCLLLSAYSAELIELH